MGSVNRRWTAVLLELAVAGLAVTGCHWDRTELAADRLLPRFESGELAATRMTGGAARRDADLLASTSAPQVRGQSPLTTSGKPASAPEIPATGQTVATVVARVNGQPILREELYNAASWKLEELRPRVPPGQWAEVEAEVLRSELELLIDRELLLQDANSRVRPKVLDKVAEAASKEFDSLLKKQKAQLGLRSDEELRIYLEKRGNSVEEMRRQHIRAFLAMEYVRSLIRDKLDQISRQDLLDYYRDHPEEFEKPERVVWQHIYVDRYVYSSEEEARQVAESVHARARQMTTEEFAALAEDPNINRSPSRLRKGQGEGNQRGQISPPEVQDVLFRLRAGEVGPLIATDKGFHIVRVVEYTPGGKIPFERACSDIRKRLQNQLGQQEYKRILEELRSKAHIENYLAQ
jgi:parvulin-like peptidyl-prolyl isomerase